MDKALERALENEVICDGNYLLKRFKRSTTYSRSIKRKATKYNNDYRIWHDYAGDYKNK